MHSLDDGPKCHRGKGLKAICIAPTCSSAYSGHKIGLTQVVALLAAISLAIIMNDGNANGIIKGVLLII